MKIFSVRKAFTLAEVLITLGIIGVVSALVLNPLVVNYQKKSTVVSLKKVYTELAQAVQLAKLEYGDMEQWDYSLTGSQFFNKYLFPFVTINSKIISTYNMIYRLSGELENNYVPLNYMAIYTLTTGAQVILGEGSSSDTSKREIVVVDINGLKNPNKLGRDVFVFEINPKGLVPSYYDDSEDYKINMKSREVLMNGPSIYAYQCNKRARGMWCAALIMQDGWQIKDDYPW